MVKLRRLLQMTPEEQRLLLGNLHESERKELRQSQYWETSLTSWLDSERPSVIREWLAKPRETFLQHLDSKAWNLAQAVEMRQEEEVEALKEIFPMWDSQQMLEPETDLDEEMDKERPAELTAPERKALLLELLP